MTPGSSITLKINRKIIFITQLVRFFSPSGKQSDDFTDSARENQVCLNAMHFRLLSDVSLLSRINCSLCCPDAAADASPSLLASPASLSLYLCFPSDHETSQRINIKILFRGIRLGNILPSNAALARARARQGINY